MYEEKPDLEYLAHYGVKGMKWGIRKARKVGSAVRKNKGKLAAAGAAGAAAGAAAVVGAQRAMMAPEDKAIIKDRSSAYKNRRKLSDEELYRRIGRLKAEKQFRDLTREDISPGQQFVREQLVNSGKVVIPTILGGAALYAGKVALTKQFSPKEAAAFVFPKPKRK